MQVHSWRAFFFFVIFSQAIYLYSGVLPKLNDGFNIEFTNPEYTANGLLTTSGGVIWSEKFRLQATQIKQYREGEQTWVEASGDLMLFYNDHLLVGDHIVYNLSEHKGILYKGALGVGSWYITSDTVILHADRSIELNKSKISTDPSQGYAWHLEASKVDISPYQLIQFHHVTVRLFHLPVLYIPQWTSSPEGLLNQPIEYDLVWKGRRKRKAGIRYKFYSTENIDLWTRLEYHVGRGPGLGLDGKFKINDGVFETSNFVAKDSSIGAPDLNERYRFKGHYHRNLSKTATFDIYYDRYGDSDTSKDYSFTSFDRDHEGQTKAVVRDIQPSFIHQATQRIKINPFQTVKKELPGYFLSPHPLYAPRKLEWMRSFVVNSHWRGEYLSYDFQDRSPINNYHSMRLLSYGQISRPTYISQFQITPSVGWKLVGYNQTPNHSSEGIVAPTGGLHAQTQWYSTGDNSHLIIAYSTLQTTGDPKTNINDHYIFDYRDAITKSTHWTQGLRQEWYNHGAPKASLILQWTKLLNRLAAGQTYNHYTLDGSWLLHARWKILSQVHLGSKERGPSSFSLRSENSWTSQFATALEYRQRNHSSWKKSNPDDYSLEVTRSYDLLLDSLMSDPHHTFITHINYQLTPNWVLRFDTAHGWDRGWSTTQPGMKIPAYQQYCLGIGTDLGSNWRLQMQITQSPRDFDWRIRIDLHDGPVIAPSPRF